MSVKPFSISLKGFFLDKTKASERPARLSLQKDYSNLDDFLEQTLPVSAHSLSNRSRYYVFVFKKSFEILKN